MSLASSSIELSVAEASKARLNLLSSEILLSFSFSPNDTADPRDTLE